MKPDLTGSTGVKPMSAHSPARRLLLAGVSAMALLVAQQGVQARPLNGAPGAPPTAAVAAAQASAAAQQAALVRAQNALQQATQAIQALRGTQAAAHNLAVSTPNSVPNGLAPGGLVPVSNPVLSALDTAGLQTWDGASLPTQTIGANGQVDVTINQTQQKAILTWTSFNIGSNTLLTFNQQGNTNWVALNRVVGTTAPSTILGQIQASGTVLVINQNGIIFGGSAQINVGSLIASTLDIGGITNATTGGANTLQLRNQSFLAEGLIGLEQATLALTGGTSSGTATFTSLTGAPSNSAVQVQAGASITANGTGGTDGLVLLMAPQITNNGYLSAPAGQVALAAGNAVYLIQATGAAGSTDPNVRGLFVTAGLNSPAGNQGYGNSVDSFIWNQSSGLIESDQGNITLITYESSSYGTNSGNGSGTIIYTPIAGGSVRNDGVLWSTTSTSRNGSILILGANVQLSPGSVIAIPPDLSAQPIPQTASSLAGFKQSEIIINGANDAAGNIIIQSGSFLYAPDANVTIGTGSSGIGTATNPAAINSIFIDSGAVIDVAGMANVQIPASVNEIVISPVTTNDLADTPLYRNSFLDSPAGNGVTLYLDPRISGVRADGVAWIGSPLIDATAYYQAIGANAAQLMTKGGNVSIGANGYNTTTNSAGLAVASTSAASNVIIKSGAVIDFSGGWVTYQAGTIRQTELISASGQIVPISQADPNTVYVGIYNGFTVDHAHWNFSQTWVDPLHSDSYYEAAYTEGRDAGSLAVGGNITVVDGTLYGQAFAGPGQIVASVAGTGTSTVAGDTRPIQASNNQLPAGGFLSISSSADIELTGSAPMLLPQSFELSQTITANANGTLSGPPPTAVLAVVPPSFAQSTVISTSLFQGVGLSELSFSTIGSVTVDANANLNLNPGGSFNVGARSITIAGNVTVPGGQINLTTNPTSYGSIFAPTLPTLGTYDINIDGELSVAGLWINNFGATGETYRPTAWESGGSIKMSVVSDATEYFNPSTGNEIVTYAISGNITGYPSETAQGTAAANSPSTYTAEDISGSIYINAGSKLDLTGGGSVNPKGKLNLTAKGGNLQLVSETSYFQSSASGGAGYSGFRTWDLEPNFVQDTAVNPSQINAKIVIDPNAIEAWGFGGGGAFTLVTPEIAFGTGTPTTGTLLPMNFFSKAGFGTYDIISYMTAFSPGTFVDTTNFTTPYAEGGYNALLATQTLAIGAGQTLLLTQSVLPSVMTPAQGSALFNLATGGDVLSAVTPAVPSDAYDQKPISLTLGGLIELDVAQGGRIIGSAGSSITVAKLYNAGTIRIPGGTITQQEILPPYYESINVGESSSTLAIGINSLSQIFTYNANGTITDGATDAIAQGQEGYGLTNEQIAGDFLYGLAIPIYFLGYLGQNQGIVLAPGSVTDLSGTVLTNPRAVGTGGQSIASGTVVGGGSIISVASTVASGNNIFPVTATGVANPAAAILPETIVAQPGAVINLAGASGTFDEYSTSGGSGLKQGSYAPTAVWSDAGSLIAMNGATLTGAIINAQGGAPQANGGTLEVLNPILIQSDPVTPTANLISANMIESAGFENFVAVNSIGTSGNVTLKLRQGFFLLNGEYESYEANGTVLGGTPTSSVAASSTGTMFPVVSATGALEIDAPYIDFSSTVDTLSNARATQGTGSVTFKADVIAIAGAVVFDQSIANATLEATGDIMLTGVQQFAITYNPTFVPTTFTLNGGLVVNGNLSIIAGQVYPTTGSTFTISSAAANGTISFARSGAAVPDTPYSAGGNLGIYAANIMQDGVIRVPFGTLTLGSNSGFGTSLAPTAYAPATQSVTLGPDSVTGVSADGLIIPYGTTTDQIEWYFAPTGAAALSAPPAKLMNINASNISIAAGATVDLSGGGDVYAYEFVPGVGGSRDVLSRTNTSPYSGDNGYQYPDGRQIYAIVPSLTSPVAAYDPIYSAGYSSLYSGSMAGEEVYLSAAPGLAAGWYTLLPAQYALLPGGMRVVVQTGATNVVPGTSIQNPDGSLLVAGHLGNALSGTSSSTTLLFSVESQAVVLQESQIVTTKGTVLTAGYDSRNSVAIPPQLAADAGQLVLNPVTNLDIATSLSAAAASGGLGAEVDIGGLHFDILSTLAGAPADGAIHITATSLTNLGAASLLIGGTRTNNSDGTTTLNVTAQSILVANDAAHPLSASEVILAVDDLVTGSVASNITLANGATILATGELADTHTKDYVINGAPTYTPVYNSNGFLEGYDINYPIDTATGAFFRVANAPQRLVDRVTNAATPVVPASNLNIGNITAQGTSISLDTSSNATFGTNVTFKAQNIAFGAHALAFTSSSQPAGTVVVTPALLALLSQANAIVLNSQTSIAFDNGTYQLGLNTTLDAQDLVSLQGGTVNLVAGAFGLGNGTSGIATAVDGTGVLNITANTVTFGSGTLVTNGFGGGVNITATQSVLAGGAGGVFNVGNANLSLTTPYLGDQAILQTSTEAAYGLTLTTGGNVNITNTGVTALSNTAMTALDNAYGVPGSSVTIQGNNIGISGTWVNATAGTLTVTAAGTIALTNGAALDAAGYDRTFGDPNDPVTRSSPGGSLTLTASGSGGISLGNALLLAGNGIGNGGSLSLSAPNGMVDLGSAKLAGAGASGSAGGTFSIYEGAVDVAALNQTTEADGFTGGFDVRTSARGDLVIAAATTITSGSVVLTADDGSVIVAGTINTSGVNGGNISLYGTNGVTLQSGSKLLAEAYGYGASDTRQATGGNVTIGTDYVPGTTSTSADGSISGTSGVITVASGAIINVSAASPSTAAAFLATSANPNGDRLVEIVLNNKPYYEVVQGDVGGTVTFRAPVYQNASNQETVDVNVANSKSVVGATAVSVQGFRRWDLAAVANSGLFTGVTYNSATNTVTLDVTAGLDTVNLDGTTTTVPGLNFLGDKGTGTLVDFVQNFNISSDYGNLGGLAGQKNFTANPGLDLETTGNIVLQSNWNLGAGTVNQIAAAAAGYMTYNAALGKYVVNSGYESDILAYDTSLTYRVGGSVTGAPGALTLRAGGNLTLGTAASTASITDGFFLFRDQSDSAYQSEVGTSVAGGTYILTGSGGFNTGGGTTALTQWSAWTGAAAPSIYLGLSFSSTDTTYLSSNAAQTITTQDAPYNWQGNSPAAAGNDALGTAVVFPLLPNGSYVPSWSYNFVAGAAGLSGGSNSPSSNPALTTPGNASTLAILGSTTYQAQAVTGSVASGIGVDSATSFGLNAAASGTTETISAWLSYITGSSFTGESPTSVALLGLGSTTDPNRAYLESLFSTFATANGLTLDQTTSSPSPSTEYRYSSNTATAANTTFIAMTLANFELFVKNYIIPNQATIAANLGSSKKAPVLGSTAAGGLTHVYTEVRTGTGSITLAAAGNVDLTGGALTYLNFSGVVTALPTTYGYLEPALYQVGGPTIYTTGHVVSDTAAETIEDFATGLFITLNPENLQAPSLFSNGQVAPVLDYSYGRSSSNTGSAGIYLTDPVYLEGGGNLTVTAGQNVLGRTDEAFYSLLKNPNNNSYYIYPWVGTADSPWYVGGVSTVATAAINPQLFHSGLGALGGGNITITAAGDVSDVTAVNDASLSTATSLPVGAPVSSLTSALLTFGSGNVMITAAGNILGGRVDVASGTAQITAGGNIENAAPIYLGTSTALVLLNVGPSGGTAYYSGATTPDEFQLRMADATVQLSALGSITIEGVAGLAPNGQTVVNGGSGNASGSGVTQLANRYAFYSDVSALTLTANGSVTLTYDNTRSYGGAGISYSGNTAVLPATFIVTSIAGNVNLELGAEFNSGVGQYLMVPSPLGELGIYAGGNILPTTIGMIDADPGQSPGLFSSFYTQDGSTITTGIGFVLPIAMSSTPDVTLLEEHNQNITHAGDPEPVYIYAEGNIGSSAMATTLSLSKQARIYAGQDILNMMFFGQNVSSTDITRIVAGRDIIGTTKLVQPETFYTFDASVGEKAAGTAEAAVLGNTFIIGGPGNFIMQAGRNLGPFMTSANTLDQYGLSVDGNYTYVSTQETFGGGIISVGNQWNPYLPTSGASLTVMFGVKNGEDFNALRDAYVAPGSAANALGGYSATLVAWMQQNDAGGLMADFGTTNVTPDQAYAAFVKLPEVRQEIFLLDYVYFNELEAASVVGSPSYGQYARGYTAVNTLFPASLGYTINSLQGGFGAVGTLVKTGDLDLRLATIETQEGGQINLLGPGGRVVAGSDVATAVQAARRTSIDAQLYGASVGPYGIPSLIASIPAGYEGIITLRGGSINSFTDGDFLLNQSRIFTEQGGGIVVWTSNGNIDAGVGPKTTADFPPIIVHVDEDAAVTVDELSGVTGAGIATLQTTPNAPPGDVYLLAPRGIVNFNAAGARVSGNLSVVAVKVENADNVQVQGTATGLPTAPVPNIAAQTAASNTAGASNKSLDSGNDQRPAQQPSIIIVEFLGFGGAQGEDQAAPRNSGEDAQKTNTDAAQKPNQPCDRSRQTATGECH